MNFTDQKSKIATEQDTTAPWGGAKNGKYFRCYLCGHKFQVGDKYRFIFSNHGNLMVCNACDENDPIQKWIELHEEWKLLREGKFWHFIIRQEDFLSETEKEYTRQDREDMKEIKYWKDKATYG